MPPSEKEPGQSDTGAAASSSKFLIDPDKWCNYKIGDPAKPIGMTESLNGQLVRKWTYDVITGEVAPVWPSQRHLVQIGPDGVEHTIRVIYDPETHAVIMRTVADRSGSTAPQ